MLNEEKNNEKNKRTINERKKIGELRAIIISRRNNDDPLLIWTVVDVGVAVAVAVVAVDFEGDLET